MSVLRIAALWALPLVLVPILIHLVYRRRHPTIAWPAMQFVRLAVQSRTRAGKMAPADHSGAKNIRGAGRSACARPATLKRNPGCCGKPNGIEFNSRRLAGSFSQHAAETYRRTDPSSRRTSKCRPDAHNNRDAIRCCLGQLHRRRDSNRRPGEIDRSCLSAALRCFRQPSGNVDRCDPLP